MKRPWRVGVVVCAVALGCMLVAITAKDSSNVECEDTPYQCPQLTSQQIAEAEARIAGGEPFDWVAWSYGFHPTDIGLYHFGRQMGVVDWEAEPWGYYWMPPPEGSDEWR